MYTKPPNPLQCQGRIGLHLVGLVYLLPSQASRAPWYENDTWYWKRVETLLPVLTLMCQNCPTMHQANSGEVWDCSIYLHPEQEIFTGRVRDPSFVFICLFAYEGLQYVIFGRIHVSVCFKFAEWTFKGLGRSQVLVFVSTRATSNTRSMLFQIQYRFPTGLTKHEKLKIRIN